MLRFYDGGGLADYKVVKCEEENLVIHLAEFEEDCVSQNLGTRLGILDEKELANIKEAIND